MKTPTPSHEVQATNARRISQIFLGANAVSSVAYLYIALKTQAWQVWALVALSLVLVSAGALSAWMSGRQRSVAGARLLVAATIVAGLTGSLLVVGIGGVLGIVIMLLSLAIAAQALPRTEINWVLIVGLVAGLGAIAIDVFGAPTRLSIPVLQNLIPYLAGGAGAAFSFLIVRQFHSYPLSTKLLASFLLVALIPLSIVILFNNRATTQNLTHSSDAALQSAAAQTAATLDTFIAERLNDVRTEAQRHILGEFLALPKADRAGSESEAVLNTDLFAIARRDQTFITSVGLLDKNGLSVADTEPTELGVDKSKRNYFIGARDNQLPYASPIEISSTTDALSMYFSAPVRDSDGKFIGVLRIRYDATVIQSIVKNSAEQANLSALTLVVFDENHIRLAHNLVPELILKSVVPLPAGMVAQLQAEGRLPVDKPAEELSTNLQTMEEGLNNLAQQPFFVAEFHNAGEGDEEGTAIRLETRPWLIAAGQDQVVFLAPLVAQTRTNMILALIIAGIVAFIALLVAQTISNPVLRLTNVAQQIAGGNLAAQASVESSDEIGTLAITFNNMSAQLKNTLDGLEQTVADRTKELEAAQEFMAKRAIELQSVAEISTKASAATNVDEMLQDLVELTKSSFNLYHAHVYLVDKSKKKLVLAAGAGDVGKQMVSEQRSIALDHLHSLVARAARTRQGAISNDVTTESDFLPNPLLPETRSEMSIPIIFGDAVLGVLDVQADHINRFTDEDIAINTTLAGQIAVTLQNVRSFAEVQARAEREALIGSISQKIQGATTVESVLQITALEMGRAVGSKQTRVILKDYASAKPTENKS